MKLNQILGLSTLVLLVLSGWTYYDSVTRGERFERGQKFFQQIDPDAIAEIVITKGTDGAEITRLRRQEDHFVLPTAGGYRAANDAVNRLIGGVMDIRLEKEVGRGEKLADELGLASGAERLEVAFLDDAEKDMVRFVVGNAAEDAAGHFIRRESGDPAGEDAAEPMIYLTSSRVSLRTGEDDLLDQEILNVEGEEIASISGESWKIVNEDGAWSLADLPSGVEESSKVDSAKRILQGLRFTEHHLANAPEVSGLDFDESVRVELDDGSWYDLELAESDGKHYLRVAAGHEAEETGLSIERDAGDAEVAEAADKWQRLEEIQDWNAFHGSWIYEISEGTAEKVGLERSELIEGG